MTAVHDKGAIVHALFGSGNKVRDRDTARPGGTYQCIRMENGGEILPFARVTIDLSNLTDKADLSCYGFAVETRLTDSMAILLQVLAV